ncbi:carbamoyltransferase HypF [Roseibium sp.]|uniref:carbamoyltransferase HypF n=1 Tax=Roseibium sp. TaxID=1936156 RepID=UPI003267900D
MTGAGTIRTGKLIRVSGLVQGVGFRPFVWQLAEELDLSGHVFNDGAGVLIEVHGSPEKLVSLLDKLRSRKPVLARIDAIDVADAAGNIDPQTFRILESREGTIRTGVVPDAATCPECLADIRNPADRRYRYPFTNCTHCGPRLSILRHIPYDRASTSMAMFGMCAACRAEYDDPADRRFHAQPVACPVCGPRLWLEEAGGGELPGDPVLHAAERLKAGVILAVKGLGGFQIAVDANNAEAVAELRRRKQRPGKPLALMARDLGQIRRFARVSGAESELLASPAAAIVLLEKSGEALAGGVAGAFDRLGFMLPNTPLHHLLMAELDGPIVLTSGNLSDNPQETDNAAARRNLSGIVDGFLMHDREVVNRLDDSVVRLDRAGPAILRRARGLAPAPVRLDASFETAPKVLAMGGELKSTFCLLDGANAILSQHIGDLQNAPTFADYKRLIDFYLDLHQFRPELIAVDCHPQFLSAGHGAQLARRYGAALVPVQHHHAHMAACLAEQGHGLSAAGRCFAVVLDGLGWGTDGTIWGGEVLAGGLSHADRVAHLPPVPLPGGAAAIREPWRNLVAHLHAAFGPGYRAHLEGTGLAAALEEKQAAVLDQMIQRGVNAPMSSSAGRLFDAVAAATGLCFDRQSFEGEAGMRLESLARPMLAAEEGYPLALSGSGATVAGVDPFWNALVADLRGGLPAAQISARFHLGLIDALASALAGAGAAAPDTVALSGGVFQNVLLRDGVTARLTSDGLRVLNHTRVPVNDGGLALGQAVIAAVQRDRR